jgi:hypothetical protein
VTTKSPIPFDLAVLSMSPKAMLMIGLILMASGQRGCFMLQYCVIVKGPCRGKSCDFWARIRLRKTPIEQLAAGIKRYVVECKMNGSTEIDKATQEYWSQMGIRNLEKLCNEEPDLYAKMLEAEALFQSWV